MDAKYYSLITLFYLEHVTGVVKGMSQLLCKLHVWLIGRHTGKDLIVHKEDFSGAISSSVIGLIMCNSHPDAYGLRHTFST